MVDLCARLRGQGHAILLQPVATALWSERGTASGDGDAPDLQPAGRGNAAAARAAAAMVARPAPRAGAFVGHALVIDDDLPRPDRDAGSIATFEQMLLLRRLG